MKKRRDLQDLKVQLDQARPDKATLAAVQENPELKVSAAATQIMKAITAVQDLGKKTA